MSAQALNLMDELPDAPNPSNEELASYKVRSDWTELFFEWHRTTGILAIVFSFLLQESPALRKTRKRNFIVLTSLLNRCGRLMMANLCMASENRHAEALSIIDRALHETAIKTIWLCKSKTRDRFDRYFAEGLRHDLEFENYIKSEIAKRWHKTKPEQRMLSSIHRSVSTSGISKARIARTKRLPDLFSMMRECGFADLLYIVIQRMGSHSVHGSWTSLLAHNLEVEGNRVALKEGFSPPHPNQLMMGSLIVLEAIEAFIESVAKRSDRETYIEILGEYRSKLLNHNTQMTSADLAAAS
jgi:hypothetical protein